MTVTINVLGEVAVGSGAITIPRAQVQVALARLVLERAVGTNRDELADTVWPNGLPATWASALRSIVSHIRRILSDAGLGDDVLQTSSGTYRLVLGDDVDVDLERAGRLVTEAREMAVEGANRLSLTIAEGAIEVLGRPFLPFQEGEWVAGVRNRATELRLTSLELAAQAAARTGRWQESLAYSDEAIRLQPLRESAHRCRMLAHQLAGNRGQALRAYQHLRNLLAEELGVDPSSETEARYLDLLWADQDREFVPVDSEAVSIRDRERDEIADALGVTAGGLRSRLVVVEGEPGSGKSELAAEVAMLAHREGIAVLVGASPPGRPLGSVVAALASYLAATPEESTPRSSRAVQEVLRSILVAPVDDLPLVVPSAAVIATLAEAIRSIADGRPLLLVIDGHDPDDRATIEVIRQLVDRRGRGPVLVLVTVATWDGASPSDQQIDELVVRGSAERTVLAGLDDDSLHRIVEVARPSDDPWPLTRELRSLSGGNPFLARAILQAGHLGTGRGAVPPSILRYLGRRLEGASAEAQRYLSAAAVMGPVFHHDIVADAIGADDGGAGRLLAYWDFRGLIEATGSGVATGDRSGLRFRHEVLRHALYQQIPEVERRSIHRVIAQAIERRLERTDATPVEIRSIARHRLAATSSAGRPSAVHWAWRAADSADALGALQLCRDALDRVPADAVPLGLEARRRLGMAERRVGLPAWTDRLFATTLDSLAAGEVEQAALAALELAVGCRTEPGRWAALLELVLSAETDGRRRGRRPLDQLVRARLMARCVLGDAAIPPAAGRSSRAMGALGAALLTLTGPARVEERRAHAEELTALAEATGRNPAPGTHHQAMAAAMLGDDLALRSALVMLRRVAPGQPWAERALAESIADLGDPGRWPTERSTTRHGSGLSPVGGDEPGLGVPVDPLVPVDAHNRLVAQWLAGGPLVAPLGIDPSSGTALDRASGLLLTARLGNTVRTAAVATGLLHDLPGMWEDDGASHVAGVLGLVAAELGDLRLADSVRQVLAPWAGHNCGVGYRSFVGPMSYHLGRLAALSGDWLDAELHLDRAVASLARRRFGPWAPLAHDALAVVLQQRGASDRVMASMASGVPGLGTN